MPRGDSRSDSLKVARRARHHSEPPRVRSETQAVTVCRITEPAGESSDALGYLLPADLGRKGTHDRDTTTRPRVAFAGRRRDV